MQSRNQIIDDLAKLMTNAMGLAQNATGELENAVKSLLDRYLSDKGLVTREEFDALKEMYSSSLNEINTLKKELNALKSSLKVSKESRLKKSSDNSKSKTI